MREPDWFRDLNLGMYPHEFALLLPAAGSNVMVSRGALCFLHFQKIYKMYVCFALSSSSFSNQSD